MPIVTRVSPARSNWSGAGELITSSPRTIATMLAPVFEPAQVQKLFGPVECYWGEGSAPTEVCRYQAQAGAIEMLRTALA